MSDPLSRFLHRHTNNPEAFANELAKVFAGGQGPAAAVQVFHLIQSARSIHATELNNIIQAHMRRAHTIAQLSNISEENRT